MKRLSIQIPRVGNTDTLTQALIHLRGQLGACGFQLTWAIGDCPRKAKFETNTIMYQFKIATSIDVYLDEFLPLTADTVAEIARFAERVYVQSALDELIPRMALLGWKYEYDAPLVEQDEETTISISILTANPKTPARAYDLTCAGMAQLHHDVDVAEVRYLMESTRAAFKALGWKVVVSDSAYTVYYDETFATVSFYDVFKAREVTQMAFSNQQCNQSPCNRHS